MSGKMNSLTLALSCLLILAACARPEYASEKPTIPEGAQKAEAARVTLSALGLFVSLVWKQAQQDDESYGAFWLKFWRPNLADQSPVPQEVSADVGVKLWMPSMGHGSSPVLVRRVDIGTYLVEDVYFSMTGDWDIQIQLNTETGLIDEVAIPVHY